MWQLSLSASGSAAIAAAAEAIIGNLSDDGYLLMTIEDLAESGNYKLEDARAALELVQQFDPIGVGARDLRECLLIQLKAVGMERSCAWQVTSDYLPFTCRTSSTRKSRRPSGVPCRW